MYHISDSFLRDLIASRSGLGPHAFVLHHASFFFQHKMPKGAGKHTQGFRVLTLTASNQNLDLRLTNPGFGQVFNFHTEILSRFLFPVGEIRQNFVWSLAGCLWRWNKRNFSVPKSSQQLKHETHDIHNENSFQSREFQIRKQINIYIWQTGVWLSWDFEFSGIWDDPYLDKTGPICNGSSTFCCRILNLDVERNVCWVVSCTLGSSLERLSCCEGTVLLQSQKGTSCRRLWQRTTFQTVIQLRKGFGL